MKRHVAATMLVLTTLGVINAHVDVEAQDGRYFGVWQGQKHDVLGWFEDRSNRLWRDCSKVQRLAPDTPTAEQVLSLIRAFSPPDSRQAELVSLQQQGPWLLAELRFAKLNPAVVVLRQQGDTLHLLERAIWSGSTAPWQPGPRIRDHIQAQALQAQQAATSPEPLPEPLPEHLPAHLPAPLLACYEPASPGLR